jgi:hypothetical protein
VADGRPQTTRATVSPTTIPAGQLRETSSRSALSNSAADSRLILSREKPFLL